MAARSLALLLRSAHNISFVRNVNIRAAYAHSKYRFPAIIVNVEPIPFINLGGKPRTHDTRDHLIGSVSAPIYTFPATHPRIIQLPYYFQGQQPACGAHAGTSLKVYLNHTDGSVNETDTPRGTWINIKRDGTSPDDGTTMDRIFKTLQSYGVIPFEPLENDVTLPELTYDAVSALPVATPLNAIASYAYLTDISFNGIKQGINDFGAVLLLIHANAQMWTAPDGQTSWLEKDVLPLRPPTAEYPNIDGHFLLATEYDEAYIYGYNSFSTDWGRGGDFYFGPDFAPQIIEAGIAHNPSTVPSPTIAQLTTERDTLLQQAIGLAKQRLAQLLAALSNLK